MALLSIQPNYLIQQPTLRRTLVLIKEQLAEAATG